MAFTTCGHRTLSTNGHRARSREGGRAFGAGWQKITGQHGQHRSSVAMLRKITAASFMTRSITEVTWEEGPQQYILLGLDIQLDLNYHASILDGSLEKIGF